MVTANKQGTTGGSYGIVFAITGDELNFYEYLVSPNTQQYRISLVQNGVVTVLKDWTTSAAILSGTSPNGLEVARNGASISVYANGQFLATVNNGTLSGLGRIGLIAASPSSSSVDARFDNFAMYPAGCLAPA